MGHSVGTGVDVKGVWRGLPVVPLAQPAGFLGGLASAESLEQAALASARRTDGGRVPVAPRCGAGVAWKASQES
ncbi:MAG TPA: hypothetical protein VGP72_22945 [Planctomycetota bacterium]